MANEAAALALQLAIAGYTQRINALQGVTVRSVEIIAGGELLVTYSDGASENLGAVSNATMGSNLPSGGTIGQVLTMTDTGPTWSSFSDFNVWFENQLL